MEKSCKTCKWVDRQFCKHPTGTCTHELNDNKFFQKWEAKCNTMEYKHIVCTTSCSEYKTCEAKDMDKIQMTEEQFNQLMHDCIITDFKTGYVNLLETRIKAIQAGYIKKDKVEEAEEMYNNLDLDKIYANSRRVLEKQHEAIQYLKERQK
jgi:hypothetical protein